MIASGPETTETKPTQALLALAGNLRWAWHRPTLAFFEALDPEGFAAVRRNPWAWLRRVGLASAAAAVHAQRQDDALQSLHRDLQSYLAGAGSADAPAVAYFCMEYGLTDALPIYSGGLGILAGDHVKEASDLGLDFVAVGLWYSHGYFAQGVDADGRQLSLPHQNVLADYPFETAPWQLTVGTPAGLLVAAVRMLRVGRVLLVLLDPDVPDNGESALRSLASHLYGGDWLTRLRQEILLGIGGLRALDRLGLSQDRVLHLNEGHCAFALAERLHQEQLAGRTPEAALATVRARSVFTTHTPVPAGHDRFGLHPTWEHRYAAFDGHRDCASAVLELGKELGREGTPFCMTVLALSLTAHRNGVSAIHGRITRGMWQDESIGHVTNGVHVPTWVAPEIVALGTHPTEAAVTAARNVLRARLVTRIHERQPELPPLRTDVLTIGFARRFAPYKRATLLLAESDRLARLVTHPTRPVQIIYAGKAHPADRLGQELMRLVVTASRDPRTEGRIRFVPDYDMALGAALVQGCDVWLNTPRRPLEASGTSGQKAGMNGCLNVSVPDGWWPEGAIVASEASDHIGNGWVIGQDVAEDAVDSEQDAADVASLFQLLEDEIVPLFYAQDAGGVSLGWARMARRSIETLTPKFSATRMLGDYISDLYRPASRKGA